MTNDQKNLIAGSLCVAALILAVVTLMVRSRSRHATAPPPVSKTVRTEAPAAAEPPLVAKPPLTVAKAATAGTKLEICGLGIARSPASGGGALVTAPMIFVDYR
jgi:hypothetical protein